MRRDRPVASAGLVVVVVVEEGLVLGGLVVVVGLAVLVLVVRWGCTSRSSPCCKIAPCPACRTGPRVATWRVRALVSRQTPHTPARRRTALPRSHLQDPNGYWVSKVNPYET